MPVSVEAAESPWPRLLLLLLMVACVTLNVIWVGKAAPAFGAFDEANHLARIFAYAEYASHDGADPVLDQPVQWPPLFHRLAACWWAATGYSHLALQLAWTAMLLLLLWAVYLLGTQLAGRWAGLIAAVFTATAPEVANYGRAVTLELPLALSVAWAMTALGRSEGLRRKIPTALFGFCAGLAWLSKGYAPVYLLGPMIVALIWGGPRTDWKKLGAANPWINALLAAVIGSAVAAWWYGGRLGALLKTLGGHVAVYHQTAMQADGSWSVAAATWGMFGPLVPILFLVGLIVLWPRRRETPFFAELLAWVFVPAVVFATAPATYSRFLMPAIPAVAILAAIALTRIDRQALRRVLTVLLVGGAIALHLGLSLMPRQSAQKLHLFARPPVTLPGAYELASRAAAGGTVLVVVRADHPYLPPGMLGYLVRLADDNVVIHLADARSGETASFDDYLLDAKSVLLLDTTGQTAAFADDETWQETASRQWTYGMQQYQLTFFARSDD